MSAKTIRIAVVLASAMLPAAAPLAVAGEPAGQASMEHVKKEVKDAAEAIKDYSAAQRDQAVAESKAALDELDTRMDRLRAKVRHDWGAMDQAARDRAAKALDHLGKQREQVAEWYGGLKHSSVEDWQQVKQGFSASYEALKASWKETEKSLGGGH